MFYILSNNSDINKRDLHIKALISALISMLYADFVFHVCECQCRLGSHSVQNFSIVGRAESNPFSIIPPDIFIFLAYKQYIISYRLQRDGYGYSDSETTQPTQPAIVFPPVQLYYTSRVSQP